MLRTTKIQCFSARARLGQIRNIMAQAREDQRPRPSTVTEHLEGTDDGWHSKITPDGPFKPERGRYHLYIGLFCPFAHRANIVRHLKGLQDIIPVSIVRSYPKGDENGWPGWKFPRTNDEYPKATVDHVFGSEYLHQVYFKADPDYKGRYSVPLLWDKTTNTVVNNESIEIMKDWQTAFNDLLIEEGKDTQAALRFYPEALRSKIDEICDWMQRDLNSGVYKAGFAPDQASYDEKVIPVFVALNKLEKILKEHGGPFALGKQLTEVDIRLYPTLIRFDTVYHQHFKCNLGMLRHDYPVLHNYMKGLYWCKVSINGEPVRAFGEDTVDFKHIKENYTKSHYDVNPKGITPRGPWPNVEEGYEADWCKLSAGGVSMPEVVEAEHKLPG